MVGLVAFFSAIRPEAIWKGAPRLAWATKLKSTGLQAEAVCEAIATTLFGCSSALAGPAARASSARAKPSIAIRVILETPRPTATAACWGRPISNRLAQYQRFQ